MTEQTSPERLVSPPGPPTLRAILPTLTISALLPFLTYRLLKAHAPSMSDVTRLLIAGSFPAAHNVIGIVRRRTIDIVGVIVLVGIVVSIVATFLSGDPKLLLIRESFVTGALGLLALSSFGWKRPLMFHIAKQMSSGQNPALVARFDALWERPLARRMFRVMTLVWSVGWLVEFALRIVMVETLTVSTVLAVSPFVFIAINLGLFSWMFWYVQRVRHKGMQAAARGSST